jgi:hypothetical protein
MCEHNPVLKQRRANAGNTQPPPRNNNNKRGRGGRKFSRERKKTGK